MLTGLWHGSAWNFVLWGLYYALLLMGEKFLWGKFLEKLPAAVRHAYALVLIIIGWVLFRSGSLAQVGQMVAAMFGAAPGGLWSAETAYYLHQFHWSCCWPFRHPCPSSRYWRSGWLPGKARLPRCC